MNSKKRKVGKLRRDIEEEGKDEKNKKIRKRGKGIKLEVKSTRELMKRKGKWGTGKI